MAKSTMGFRIGNTVNANVTNYYILAGGGVLTTSEVETQRKFGSAGDFRYFQIRIDTNTLSVTSTVNLRINGANGTNSVSATAASTGLFQDTTNTDTIAINDLINIRISNPAGSGSGTYGSGSIIFDSTDNFCDYGGNGSSISTASSNFYKNINGSSNWHTTESDALLTVRAAFVMKYFRSYVFSNARTSTTTYRTRKNGANGGQSVSVTSTATGAFEDISNTDTLASGDTFNYGMTTGSGTGAILDRFASVNSTSSNRQFYVQCGSASSGQAVAQNVTTYLGLNGTNIFNTTEATRQLIMREAYTASRMVFTVSANTANVTTTVRTRVSGANGSQTLSITSTSTGTFEDTTNSDTIIATDSLNYQVAVPAGSGSVTFKLASMMLTAPSAPTSAIKTFLGLVYASTKTVDGLAKASVKTWEGLA